MDQAKRACCKICSTPVSVFNTAEPLHGHTKRPGQHQQLRIADVPLIFLDPGDDQGRDLHAHQIDLPCQVLLAHGWLLHGPSQPDPEYALLFRQMNDLEKRCERIMETLPYDVQDVIRDYVNQCEDMSRRMLECACEEILHPENFL